MSLAGPCASDDGDSRSQDERMLDGDRHHGGERIGAPGEGTTIRPPLSVDFNAGQGS
ncbi:hypothetical protein [Cellulomonas sp. URHB0016]